MAKTEPKDITMWAVIMIDKRCEWINWGTIARTRAESKRLHLDGWGENGLKIITKNYRETWRLSKVNVGVE